MHQGAVDGWQVAHRHQCVPARHEPARGAGALQEPGRHRAGIPGAQVGYREGGQPVPGVSSIHDDQRCLMAALGIKKSP